MLVLAVLALALAVLAMGHRSIALHENGELSLQLACAFSPTLILLSRQGTQAVVTCFRGGFFGLSRSGDIGGDCGPAIGIEIGTECVVALRRSVNGED